VDSIETERSRITLHELEPGWWILASIDLTRLPTARPSTQKDASTNAQFEYSSREVAPPQLVLQHLLRAHTIFLLHHGTSLSELYGKSSRVAFCDLLDRFWSRYIRNWDVLLHGNPAVDIYNGIKLAAGGELGVGVGEEDWGSGEREVLEGFISRTEGLVDLFVSRFGDAPAEQAQGEPSGGLKKSQVRQDPWLGTNSDPRSSDGIIFSGIGAISRRSLATVSQWMEWIYKYGEGAYGVRENPSSRHRRRRKRPPADGTDRPNESRSRKTPAPKEMSSSPVRQQNDLRREAMKRSTAGPNIPPPLVSVTQKSVEKASSKAQSREASPVPNSRAGGESAASEDSSPFAADKMIKILSLGYGSSWTLSSKGLSEAKSSENPTSTPTLLTDKKSDVGSGERPPKEEDDASEEPELQEVDPKPEQSDSEDVPFVQRLEQSIGRFIIGLPGDLENTEMIDDEPEGAGDIPGSQGPRRVFLRTLTLECADTSASVPSTSQDEDASTRPGSSGHDANNKLRTKGSAWKYQKCQVAVYVHQPFIFVFLLASHTPMLSFPSFYRNIHHQLGPLQKPLLKSTDLAKVAQRIAEAVGERSSTTIPPKKGATGPVEAETIYDIIFDPDKLTIRTSIPNIPVPGTLAAEGLSSFSRGSITVSGSWYTLGIPISTSASTLGRQTRSGLEKTAWTRVEALNVHTQILNTWSAAHDNRSLERRIERERTVKTARGWWILWMRVPSTSDYGVDGEKEAFLVRKSADPATTTKRWDASSTGSGSKWLLRDRTGDTSGTSAGNSTGTTGMTGIHEGVGVDARKWVDGLLSLNR
jgi:hypothetical protein